MPDFSTDVLIYGCGNMGGAMLRGWLAAGQSPSQFVVIDPVGKDLPDGVRHYRSSSELGKKFEMVILGIKPQMLDMFAPDINSLLASGATIISILAGSLSSSLSRHFPDAHIVRLMPNLAAAMGLSPLGLFAATLNPTERQGVEAFLSPLGTPVWIDEESQMDAVTALAGSGPAFVYRFIDAMAKGGEAAGLSQDISARLALATVEGAARLAAASSERPAELAARVTSPGGTTSAGLAVLDADDAMQKLITATLKAARDRGSELAKGE